MRIEINNEPRRKVVVPPGFVEWVAPGERRRRLREARELHNYDEWLARKQLLDTVGSNPGEDAPG